ncbi:MAG: hypothetical protein IPK64_15650 [bacterium]|nr:hypothetical protein [bacterium]
MSNLTLSLVRALVTLLAALALALPVRAAESECHVRFISTENVYLDAGSAAGLDVGMKVRIVRGGKAVAELEVAFVAEHSASCRVVSGAGTINTGDRAVFEPVAAAAPAAAPDTLVSRARVVTGGGAARRGGAVDRLDGWFALQWDHSAETADRERATDLLSLPFRVRARDLGRGFEFHGRGNLRWLSRDGYGTGTPTSESRHRLLEAALVREGRDLGWQLAVGRVGGRRTSAAGPFDGLAVSRRLGARTSLGAFGGFAPAWGELGFSTDDHLAGVVLEYDRAGTGGRYLDVTLAAVGRYRGGEISREHLSLVTSWRDGRRLSVLQAAEVDLYRGWRREETGKGAALTSTALTGRLQATRSLALTLGYDGREPVRTWETRSLPDSLFTEAGRNGWRGGFAWRGAGGLSLDVSGGLRHEQRTGDDVTSWQAFARVPARMLRVADVTVSTRGFDGPWLSGWSPSLRAMRQAGGTRWTLEAGLFSYTGKAADTTRENTWAELGLSRGLGAGWDLTGSLRNDWGDDISGRRVFLEMGRRF